NQRILDRLLAGRAPARLPGHGDPHRAAYIWRATIGAAHRWSPCRHRRAELSGEARRYFAARPLARDGQWPPPVVGGPALWNTSVIGIIRVSALRICSTDLAEILD